MSKVSNDGPHGNSRAIKYRDPGAVTWTCSRTGLGLRVVDAALVALTVYDQRKEITDRELAEHLVEHVGLDEFTAHRLVKTWCVYVAAMYEVQSWLRLPSPDDDDHGGAA